MPNYVGFCYKNSLFVTNSILFFRQSMGTQNGNFKHLVVKIHKIVNNVKVEKLSLFKQKNVCCCMIDGCVGVKRGLKGC
jgi:hypothetical protein